METMRDLRTGGVIQQVTSIGGQIGGHLLDVLVSTSVSLTNHWQVFQPSASIVRANGL